MKQQRSRSILEEGFRAHLAATQLVVKRAALLAAVVAAMPALLVGGFMAVAGSLLDGATMFIMIFAEVGLFASIIPLIIWFQRVRIPQRGIRETIDDDDVILDPPSAPRLRPEDVTRGSIRSTPRWARAMEAPAHA